MEGGARICESEARKRESKAWKRKSEARKRESKAWKRKSEARKLENEAWKSESKARNVKARLGNVKARLRNAKPQRSFSEADKARHLQLHLPGLCDRQVGDKTEHQ